MNIARVAGLNGSEEPVKGYPSGTPRFDASGQLAVFNFEELTDGPAREQIILWDRSSQEYTSIGLAGDESRPFPTEPDISDDGRYVLHTQFTDSADGNSTATLVRYDRQSDGSLPLALKPDGAPLDDLGTSRISGDGQTVVFLSADGDLVADDTNGVRDVFVHRLYDASVERVSVSSEGTQISEEYVVGNTPSLSTDGTRVAFMSNDPSLVPGDTNEMSDIFLRDISTGSTARVNTGPGGAQTDSFSFSPSITAQGNAVAYVSRASNLVVGEFGSQTNAYVTDLDSGLTELVSPIPTDPSTDTPFRGANSVEISADGQTVVFDYSLTPIDNPDRGENARAFIYDRATGELTRPTFEGQTFGLGPKPGASTISADGATIGLSSDFIDFADVIGPAAPVFDL